MRVMPIFLIVTHHHHHHHHHRHHHREPECALMGAQDNQAAVATAILPEQATSEPPALD
jgi:hypothetical protein